LVPVILREWSWGTYIFFAAFLAVGIVWVHFCLPETRGVSLEEMDKVFGSRTGEEDAIMLAEARQEIGLSMSLENDTIKSTMGNEKGSTRVEQV
jgi:hypothetical protein